MIWYVAVQNFMSRDIVTVDASGTIWDAVNSMVKNEIGSVVVVKEEKPVGILTERDILKRVVLPKLDYSTTKVEQVMSAPLITADVKTSIQDATSLMIDKKIRRLLISEGDRIVGIATQKDLQRHLLDAFNALRLAVLSQGETKPSKLLQDSLSAKRTGNKE